MSCVLTYAQLLLFKDEETETTTLMDLTMVTKQN